MANFKKGEKVLAHINDDERVGFVLDPGANPDGKHSIQVGDVVHPLAYREPENYGDDGSNGTFQKL
jgi:hypothetical protein